MPGPTGPSPRMIGLTLASIMLVVFALIIWRSITPPSANPNNPNNAFPDDSREVPNLEDLEQGASMLVTIVDRDDPTRVAGTLQADQFEPIGGGQRRLVNPDAWIFMRDGRRVHITARDGVVMMPDPNQAPDSGTLEGDVTITAYDAIDHAASPTDPLDAAMGLTATQPIDETPSMTAVFDQPVEFERRYQRLTSKGRFTVDSPGLEFIGHNLTVMLNEVKNRIELIDVRRGERLVLHPDAQKPTQQDKSTQTTHAPRRQRAPAYQLSTVAYPSIALAQDTAPGASSPTPTQPDNHKPYHIEFQDQVLVDMIGTGTLNADDLTIWAMLIDGALSPTAIKDLNFKPTDQPPTNKPANEPVNKPASQPAATQSPASSAPTEPKSTPLPTQPSPVPAFSTTEGDVVITWTGPLTVRPIEDPSTTLLTTEELALEFTSEQRVTFNAPTQGVTGSTNTLRYSATSGILDLIATKESPTQISADQSGTIRSANLSANLADGVISINAPGQLESIQATDNPRAKIDWSTFAEFTLAKSSDDTLTSRLQSAYFEGEVLGTRADAVLTTDTLRAELDTQGPLESALRTITMHEGSLQSDSGSLTAQDLVIGFVPILNSTGVTPSTLAATGAVLVVSKDGRIQSDQLNANLIREYDGQTRVRTATAIGNTEFLGQRETIANGHRLELNTDNNTIHILADPASAAQATAGQGGSIIHASDIHINTRSKSIQVQGPGTFDHDILTQGIPTGGHLRVNWDDSMRFDDALGAIECQGNVLAVSTPDAYTIDTLKADRLEIDLTPAPGVNQIINPDAPTAQTPQRELYQARAFGRAIPGQDPVRASVESRTFDPTNPEFAIGVMYLEGPQLIADNRAQTLNVPAAGMLVLMDRSADQAPSDAASVMPSTSGPAITRMTWLGSMNLNRVDGTAQVLTEVNIRHKSLTTGRVSELGCEELDAEFTPSSASFATASGAQPTPITMHRANASGRVRFSDLQRTLLSDHAIYNAQAGTLFAFADDNRLVTLRDQTQPTPVSARTLLWDLNKDLVEIDAPTPVRAPARP